MREKHKYLLSRIIAVIREEIQLTSAAYSRIKTRIRNNAVNINLLDTAYAVRVSGPKCCKVHLDFIVGDLESLYRMTVTSSLQPMWSVPHAYPVLDQFMDCSIDSP